MLVILLCLDTSSSSSIKDVSSINDVYNLLSNYAEKLMNNSRENILKTLIEPKDKFQYHNYDSMVEKLKELNNKYPNITSLYTIGKSNEKRDLWVMIISDQPLIHEPGEPEVKYIGNMHGDESVGRECLILFIEYLCINYEKHDYITQLVNNIRIHIMPTMNPDGFEYEYKQTVHALGNGRLNANQIDLNRNFPKLEFERLNNKNNEHNIVIPKQNFDNTNNYLDELTNTKEKLEPEVRAVMHWSLIYPFVLSANLHGGALVANYPFDSNIQDSTSKESKSPDDQTFKMLAKAYSYAHPKMYQGNACVRFNDGITNGAAWYIIDGGMQDWSYAYTSDMEITIELGCNKYPDETDLKSYWDDNKGALLAYITQVVHGIRGFVFDSKTKIPLSGVMIHVNGIEHNVSSYRDGDFFRLLTPGIYDITAERVGYQSETKQNILVGSQSSTYIEFKLKRKDFSNTTSINNDTRGTFSAFVNLTSTNVRTLYHQTKDFILHQNLFLIIAGIFALLVAIIFIFVVIYLKFCQKSTSRTHTGFQRYEPLVQDENDLPIMERQNGRKILRNNHALASESSDDDDGDQTLFSSKIKKPMIP
ncbi:unnamed protein product [Rotaria sp. Silwood1]|nr:unnamed protein product [Rotaria sp. Silwood1]CAF1634326.1 unnamed protein product [Rotaria sp. Silwood1]